MKCSVQIISTPTADTPGTTLLLHHDSKRYLIGHVGEGLQRACIQRGISLSKLTDIFLSGSINWATTGGMMGMILTAADVQSGKDSKNGKPWLSIHGGKNLTHMLATARNFIFRKGMTVFTNEFRLPKFLSLFKTDPWKPTWSDEFVRVWAMPIESESTINQRGQYHANSMENGSSTSMNDLKQDDMENQDDQMRKSVVSSMFGSEWRLDTLVSTPLSQVPISSEIFLRDEKGKIVEYSGPKPGEGVSLPAIDVLVRTPWPGAFVTSLPATSPDLTSVSYIFKNHPQRGKFQAAEAKRLGVKLGPDFKRLAEGESVIAMDGSTVTPGQVLAEGKEGGGFAVIDLPDVSYVSQLLQREEWTADEVMSGVGAIFWILGPGVLHDPNIRQFMQDRGDLHHIVSSEDTCANYLAFESATSAAIRLHLVDPERFPIPKFDNRVGGPSSSKSSFYQAARLGQTINLEPTVQIQSSRLVTYLDTAQVINEMPKAVLGLAETARSKVCSQSYQENLNQSQEDIPSKDAEIITLGTGSALPSKYRNVSATLLRVPGYGSYLFDCGENTLGQLKRTFGSELPEVLRDLKVLWLSHLHADHHLGTVSLIKAWYQEVNKVSSSPKRLIVASGEKMIAFLEEYASVEDIGLALVDLIIFAGSGNQLQRDFGSTQPHYSGLSSIKACKVNHCHDALAVVFEFSNGFKVAYSGDCRPSSEFARIGYGATVLIHEATFDDELGTDARAKKHCTTSEAISVGRQMSARRILLTHFSQRYQKIPVMDQNDTSQAIIVAFDYMRVRVGDFEKLSEFRPALLKLYEPES